jgi:hypothetical protein
VSIEVSIAVNDQQSGPVSQHTAAGPGPLVLPVLFRAVNAAIVAYPHELVGLQDAARMIGAALTAAGQPATGKESTP